MSSNETTNDQKPNEEPPADVTAETVPLDAETVDAEAPAEGADGDNDGKTVKADFKAANAARAYSKVQEMKPEDFPAEAEAQPADNAPDYKEIAARTAADFDNYRKRVARERADWQRDVLANFLKGFLPAFDDLDRAIAESEKTESVEIVREGTKIARANLWETMTKAGVKEIDALHKKFDPRFHEALSMVPMPGAEPNTVIEIFQPGYMIGDFVVRPAKVVVASQPN